MNNILYVNHSEKQCGVYQFGKTIGLAIAKSRKFNFIYCECGDLKALRNEVSKHRPACVIFNFHPSTQSWVSANIRRYIKAPLIGTIHEVTQHIADNADNRIFDYHIAADPTLLLRNPIVYKTGRLIAENPVNPDKGAVNADVVIGSFGFGTNGKGFEKIIRQVESEFDHATIRLNIPFAEFGDKDGRRAREISDNCRKLLTKSTTNLLITHNFWSREELMQFLDGNSMNVFFYDDGENRGISSVIDFALGVERPLAITKSSMFRHIRNARPSICIEEAGLKEILANGTAPLKRFKEEWTAENLLWDYERIVADVLGRPAPDRTPPLLAKARRIFKPSGDNGFTWLRENASFENEEAAFKPGRVFIPLSLPRSFNRILDNSARELYAPVIAQMERAMPETMAKKIPEANVQQAFALDAVYSFASGIASPKILCIGSYESTDAMFLKQAGFDVEEIDPVLNYSLDEFFSRPSTLKNAYDIIFSTSVIEHVEEDELFVRQMADLLRPGGTGVITCDFREGYVKGDPKPEVDFRFYTREDLAGRLMTCLPDCQLLDPPRWDGAEPDFHYGGYTYTFATFCFRKNA